MLDLRAGAGLTVGNLTLGAGAQVVARDSASIEVSAFAAVTGGAVLEIVNGSIFEQGENATLFLVDGASTVSLSESSQLILSAVSQIYSKLDLSSDSIFSGNQIYFYQSQVIETSPTFNITHFIGASGNFTNGLFSEALLLNSSTVTIYNFFDVSYLSVKGGSNLNLRNVKGGVIRSNNSLGDGNILIASSQITLNTSYMLPNAQLTFTGTSAITATTVSLRDLKYEVDNGVSPYIQVTVLNGIQINSSISFPGSLLAYGSFYATGDISFSGPIQLVSSQASVNGKLASIGGFRINSTTLQLANNAVLNSSCIFLDSSSTLVSLSTSSIFGSFTNLGEVQISATTPISISGDYNSVGTSKLTVAKITRTTTSPFVTAAGSATLAGIVNYDPIVVASGETVKLSVLYAANGIQGKFVAPTGLFESFQYNSNTAYLVFSESASTSGSNAVLPGLPLMLVLLFFILFIPNQVIFLKRVIST